MGFIREYPVVLAIIAVLLILASIWHLRGNYDEARGVEATEEFVQPIEGHIHDISENPLSPGAVVRRWLRHSF